LIGTPPGRVDSRAAMPPAIRPARDASLSAWPPSSSPARHDAPTPHPAGHLRLQQHRPSIQAFSGWRTKAWSASIF
jgi:hypothetical protein